MSRSLFEFRIHDIQDDTMSIIIWKDIIIKKEQRKRDGGEGRGGAGL